MSKEQIFQKMAKEKKKIPMGDDTIKKYFPNMKVITYSELKNVKNIKELLPHNKSCFVLLYQHTEHSGHWVCVCRFNDKIEFFDSYGEEPDTEQLIPEDELRNLGIEEKYLTNLFKNSGMKVEHNNVKYQSDNGKDINTCGRHCVFRLLNMLEKDRDLKDYYKFMKQLKNMSKEPYDKIVSLLIEH